MPIFKKFGSDLVFQIIAEASVVKLNHILGRFRNTAPPPFPPQRTYVLHCQKGRTLGSQRPLLPGESPPPRSGGGANILQYA